MADFASKFIKLNFPSNLLGNFDSSFVSNEGQLSRKSARQFRQQILPPSSSAQLSLKSARQFRQQILPLSSSTSTSVKSAQQF